MTNRNGKMVAGVDGCRGGWLVIRGHPGAFASVKVAIVTDLAQLAQDRGLACIAVDMPIGLSALPEPGGRAADRAARAFLARRFAAPVRAPGSRVFSAPTAAHVAAFRKSPDYANVNAAHAPERGLSRQSFGLLPKVAQLDTLIAGDCPQRIFEVHPEVSFAVLAGQTLQSKKSPSGRAERAKSLGQLGFELERLRASLGPKRSCWQEDDLLDACICCWSAVRIAHGLAFTLPDHPPTGDAGRPVAIHA